MTAKIDIVSQCKHYNYRTTQEFIDCQIISTPGKYDFKPLAIGYRKDSPYAEMFDFHIGQIRATGVLDKIKIKYNNAFQQECPDLRLVVGTKFSL